MVSTENTVLLQQQQLDEAGEMLGRAFYDDPLMVYVLPDDEKRRRLLPWFMSTGARFGLRNGEVHTTPDKIEGAAVWVPPAGLPISNMRMIMAGMWLVPFKAGLAVTRRFMGVMDLLEKHHEQDVPAQHWYLMILGVEPERQGQGVGGRLIQPVLARADSDQLPCYLETMKEINVTFYRKHGFAVVSEGEIPDEGGPHYWTMRRDARG